MRGARSRAERPRVRTWNAVVRVPTIQAMTDATRAGPLAGLRVLELGSFIAGPFAGQLLGDYGAEVIKIETPGEGDPMRRWGLTRDGQGLWWPAIARNKRSVAVDLRAESGRDLVRRLADRVDVVLENFRPGRLDEWGLGYEALRRSNPGVIVVHVSGFGQTGPRSSEAGFGSIGEAMGGIRATTGDPDRPPARCGISLGDALAGLFAVVGTLAAVAERSRSGSRPGGGRGHLRGGGRPDGVDHGRLRGGRGHPDPDRGRPARRGTVQRLPDGRRVRRAHRRQRRLGVRPALRGHGSSGAVRPTSASSTTRSRGRNMDELDELIAGWTRGHDTDALLALMSAHGVPAGRVYTPADMLTDGHFQAREMVVRAASRAGYEVPMPGVVPKFSRTPGGIADVGPDLGEHTRQVLSDLAGVGDAEWSALVAAGVVAGPLRDAG